MHRQSRLHGLHAGKASRAAAGRIPKVFTNLSSIEVTGESRWGRNYVVLNDKTGVVYVIDQQPAHFRMREGANYVVSKQFGGMISKFRTLNQAYAFVNDASGSEASG